MLAYELAVGMLTRHRLDDEGVQDPNCIAATLVGKQRLHVFCIGKTVVTRKAEECFIAVVIVALVGRHLAVPLLDTYEFVLKGSPTIFVEHSLQ